MRLTTTVRPQATARATRQIPLKFECLDYETYKNRPKALGIVRGAIQHSTWIGSAVVGKVVGDLLQVYTGVTYPLSSFLRQPSVVIAAIVLLGIYIYLVLLVNRDDRCENEVKHNWEHEELKRGTDACLDIRKQIQQVVDPPTKGRSNEAERGVINRNGGSAP